MGRQSVTASAPSRIDLAGGTLDIWPLSQLLQPAVTVNLAIELRATATISSRAGRRVEILSRDRRRRASRRLPLGPTDLHGPLALPLRLLSGFAPRRGLRIVCEATAPAGAGLGGSSTLGIALGAALNRHTAAGLGKQGLLRRVMNLETIELGVPTGNQDYLAAVHGGLAAYHHETDGTRRERLTIPRGLQDRLVLAYTGQPRQSGLSNWDMFRRFIDGERVTVRRMRAIARISRELRDALSDGDLDGAGKLIGEEGKLRYRLAPTVATPALLNADRAARRAGALGAKVCGAGGGGCILAFARQGRAAAVARAMAATGARILDATISKQGVRLEPA
jgi:D-glycero-alpha-D-manno-heptose-7-phosphate kinase